MSGIVGHGQNNPEWPYIFLIHVSRVVHLGGPRDLQTPLYRPELDGEKGTRARKKKRIRAIERERNTLRFSPFDFVPVRHTSCEKIRARLAEWRFSPAPITRLRALPTLPPQHIHSTLCLFLQYPLLFFFLDLSFHLNSRFSFWVDFLPPSLLLLLFPRVLPSLLG